VTADDAIPVTWKDGAAVIEPVCVVATTGVIEEAAIEPTRAALPTPETIGAAVAATLDTLAIEALPGTAILSAMKIDPAVEWHPTPVG
jgi:hypothetical protein